MRPRLFVAMVAVGTLWGCTTLLGLDDLEYRDQDAGTEPDADLPPAPGSVLWSKQVGAEGDDLAQGVAVDPLTGDAVVSGCTTDVDAGVPGCAGQAADVFVSRYSPEGELRWDKVFGGSGNQFAEDLAGGPTGAVVAGRFDGNFAVDGPPLVNAGSDDIFLAKLGSAGGHLWSVKFGTGGLEQAFRVATDPDENVILTGAFDNTVDFGGGALTGPFMLNPFLAKFDASGGLAWSKTFATAGRAYASGVGADASGNVLLTGLFAGAIDFGNGWINGSPASLDAFVATFNPDGGVRWSVPMGGAGTENGVGVAADGDGNVVVAGSFDVEVALGEDPLTTAGMTDIFVAKYARNTGMLVWSTRFGGESDDVPQDILVDAAGNIVITGTFNGTADFQGTELVSAGLRDIFLVMLDPDGVVTQAQRFGDLGEDIGHRLAFGPSGEIFMAGTFGGTIRFGEEFLQSLGANDAFLVKFAPP